MMCYSVTSDMHLGTPANRPSSGNSVVKKHVSVRGRQVEMLVPIDLIKR